MTSNWLQDYLGDAVARKLCTSIYCTTCGAMEFRQGVLDALAKATGRERCSRGDRECVIEVAKALAGVKPTAPPLLEEAVRLVIFELRTGVPLLDREIKRLLAGSWAGEVLASMKTHYAAREAADRARAELEDPVKVQQRRDERKRLRREKHEQRLALKKERDRIWREKQGKVD
jgi:hypothetical protein